MNVQLLVNPIQHYAWGSRTFIAELQGRRTPAPTPEAELWMGAHPSAPSRIDFDRTRSLAQVIRADPLAALGKDTFARFANELPFLMKVLAADEPLSLQAHPSRARAAAGFHAEAERGLSLDSPKRNYKDPRHKPELIVALTPFFALSGFRKVKDTRRLFASLDVKELEPFLEPLGATDPSTGLRRSFERLLGATKEERARLVERVLASARARAENAEFGAELAWLDRLGALYPNDIGVVCALFLNLIELLPGQALYLSAGNLHAYLRGAGMEIMASSDNVLRGGLTEKRVDVPELLAVLEFSELELEALEPERTSACELVYRTPAEEFELSRLDCSEAFTVENRQGPEILFALRGHFALTTPNGSVELLQGAAAFVPASEPRYTIRGSGSLFRARVPQHAQSTMFSGVASASGSGSGHGSAL